MGALREQPHQPSSGNLLYIVTIKAIVVVSYPGWQIVATIPGSWSDSAVCSDPNTGNVFVTDEQSIIEYAHGGTSPIATLGVPSQYGIVYGCAVDPTTGNLAVASRSSILVYPEAQGSPTPYADKHLTGYRYPAYDDSGDLFSGAGTNRGRPRLAELRTGQTTLTALTLNGAGFFNKLQWDGRYLVFDEGVGEDSASVYQIQVGRRSGTVVKTISLGKTFPSDNFWIWDGSLFGFFGIVKRGDDEAVAAWRYPAGGRPTSHFFGISEGKKDQVGDLTVSVQPSP